MDENPLPEEQRQFPDQEIEEAVEDVRRRLRRTAHAASKKVPAAQSAKTTLADDGQTYRYCQVRFEGVSRAYSYLTEDETIQPGDWVLAPLGWNNQERAGRVERVDVYTFVLTVVFDLVVAIEVGMVLACVLFMKRMSEETYVRGWVDADEENDPESMGLRKLPKGVQVYEINGPLFFGAANCIADILFENTTKCLILRMRSVPALDITALNAMQDLHSRCQGQHVTLILSHVNEQPMRTLEKAGFVQRVGEENFCACIDDALARAEML